MTINEIIQQRLNRPENKGDDFGFTNQYGHHNKRIINKDGSFNLIRVGEKKSLFHTLITTTWPRFFLFVFSFYVIINMLFACVYLVTDFDGIGMTADYEVMNRFLIASFFSAQTLTTVGYGSLYPLSSIISTIAAIEALMGLMSFAIFTGLMYGRFSKPRPGIRFSKNMLYAPHKQAYAFMFRVANERNHTLTELEARMLMSIIVLDNGKESRKYQSLQAENNKITNFPLNWTVVHYIDESSPLFGLSMEALQSSQIEMLVTIRGYNESAGQDFQSKSSYTTDEIVWNAKFKIPYFFREDGVTVFELDRIDEYQELSQV
ncbi:MAG: ion channel [Bacteroidota bacterium]|nr:ion channel [Bacteroidota bacterium]